VSTPATSFNEREFVTCQISRLVEDKYIYWVGGGGEPLSSVLLAKRMSAPNLQYLTEDGVVGPEAQVPFDPLMTMISSRANYRALQWGTMNYAADLAHLGYVDYGILATLQVDRYGNVNSTVIGKYDGGEGRRFGGPGGADSIAALAWRTILVTDQQKRKFVDRVDFISSPGFLDGPGARERHGLPPNTGPWRVYTPWAMFGYSGDCQLMLQGIAQADHRAEAGSSGGPDRRRADSVAHANRRRRPSHGSRTMGRIGRRQVSFRRITESPYFLSPSVWVEGSADAPEEVSGR